MKNCIFLILMMACLAPFSLYGQGFTGDWRIALSAAGQQHDTRFFRGNTLRDAKARDNSLFSWHIRAGVFKPLLHRPDFSLDLGLAYGLEANTLTRPFNYCYLTLPPNSPFICPLTLFFMDDYLVHQIQVPLSLRKRVVKLRGSSFLYVSGEAVAGVSFRKAIRKYGDGTTPLRQTELRPYALEINAGLGYQYHAFSLEMTVRALQWREWDPVILVGSSTFNGQGPPTPTDTYNPFKLWLTLSYDLRAGQPPRSWWGKKGKK